MDEAFLHYLWRFRLMGGDLRTIAGEPVAVIHPGEHNPNGGPDFLNARVRIGETLWAGNIEIHLSPDDWYRHLHHQDKAYENVILHVVYEHNGKRGPGMPTLEVKGTFAETIMEQYRFFQHNGLWIPCEQAIGGIDLSCFTRWVPALVVERLISRNDEWHRILELNGYDWEETFYQGLAKVFGIKINTIPFELLAKSLPLRIILKHKENPHQLESLVFGQAGMLKPDFKDLYPQRLYEEYQFLADKYSLSPIDPSLWRFLRLRPSGFPTIRLAQWAFLMQKADSLFSSLVHKKTLCELMQLFTVKASDYWDDHYLFDKPAPVKPKVLGSHAVQGLMVNMVVSFLFFFGEEKGICEYRENAMELMEELPPEDNSVISSWRSLGLPISTALDTQALLQLKTHYCSRKRCLDCRIGNTILR